MRRGLCLAVWLFAGVLGAQSTDGMFASGAVAGVLDAFHAAAAAANEDKYFSLLTSDAAFLGTDPTERWTRDEFRKWAHPHFASGKGWTYRAKARWISFSPDRRVSWFDETLANASLGTCRGSGVLVLQPDGSWKIAQYNLSIPIPNALTDEIVGRIAAGAPPKEKK
jgi:hypothetical protein